MLSREPELARVRAFACGPATTAGLVLVGEPGVGKTTVWEQGLRLVAEAGVRVLWARSSAAEMSMSFAALRDLLDGIDLRSLDGLPEPQLRALEIAVRRAELDGAPQDPLAISAGFLGVVRLLASEGPLLIAVDDVQWLDQSSHDVLTFAARRNPSEAARFLLARRPGRASDLERALRLGGLERVELAGLSLGSIGRLVSERLDVVLQRRLVRQLHETSQGNPLYALELARLLVERGLPDVGEELPFPELDENIFEARILGLTEALRRALLAVGLSADLSRTELESLVDPAVVDEGVQSGVLLLERGRFRPSHGLLAAAARHHATVDERRRVHRDLAAAVEDPLRRAHHLAAATVAPDSELAAEVAAAAEIAAERGAPEEAAVLARHALRLTRRDSPDAAARVIMLAECRLAVGDHSGTRSLLTSHLEELPKGPLRARALLLRGLASEVAGEMADLELALAEAPDDPEIRADVLKRKAVMYSLSDVHQLDQAEIWSNEALDAARQCGPAVEARARYALDWVRVMRGKPIIEAPATEAVPPTLRLYEESLDRPRGVRAAFRGETDDARRIFQDLRDRAAMRGESRAEVGMVIQLCELELRCGNLADAALRLDELDQWADLGELVLTQARLEAVLAAMSGEVAHAVRRANVVLGRARELHAEWDRIEASRALGLCALLENDAERAVELFGQIWDLTVRERVDDPGAFPVAGDLVEALLMTGDLDSASTVIAQLGERAEEQHHPWGLIVVERGRGALKLHAGMDDVEIETFEDAAQSFDQLGLRFDGCRTRLQLGRIQRRYRKSGAARRSLTDAAAGFDQLGCRGWAEQARSEMSRLGGRPPAARNELTPSEKQVADLAARGLTNKDIAQQLYISVYTVEQHLSKVYAKLGVRSRSQLAGRLAD